MIPLKLSSLISLVFSLVLLSSGIAITHQRDCYEWEYPCPNSINCCNCLMCPKDSACSQIDTIEQRCRANIEITSYENCFYVAHCGWTETEATFPTCQTISPQKGIRVNYITPPAEFQEDYFENHLLAKAQISCIDGTNSTVVTCLPGGTDGNGGRWNSSTSIKCSSTINDGAVVVSTPTKQKPSPTPSSVIATSDDSLDPTPTLVIHNNTSEKNSTADNSGLPVFAIALIVSVTTLVAVGLAVLSCWCWWRQHSSRTDVPDDDGPKPGDSLLEEKAAETTSVQMDNNTDHFVSRNNNHAYENGHCVGKHISNGDIPKANGVPHIANGVPHIANGGLHIANGGLPIANPCRLVEATDRIPGQSDELSLKREHLEMQTRGDNHTMLRNLEDDRKESMKKVMPVPNSHPSPQQPGHVAVVNPLSPAPGSRRPEETDDRNIPGSDSRSSLSSAGSASYSDNQDRTRDSETFVKKSFDPGEDMDQEVGNIRGSDEGLPTADDLSKADPVNHRNDGQNYYTGPGTPEEVEANQPAVPLAGEASGQAQDRTLEEHGHASGGPSGDSEERGISEFMAPGMALNNAAARSMCPYSGNPNGEDACNTTLKQASRHINFQAFVPHFSRFTDQKYEFWRHVAVNVCEESRTEVLENMRYIARGDSRGIGGGFLYNYATNNGASKKIYRLVHLVAYHDRVPQRLDFLKLIKDSFTEHSESCQACKDIFQEKFGNS